MLIKKIQRRILRAIDPKLEMQMVDQDRFNQLKRKPPELIWKVLEPGPHRRMDAGGIQIKNKLYVFAGYRTADIVLDSVDVFDFDLEQWVGHLKIPAKMGRSHLGMIGDEERYIYAVSGQVGNQCHPPVAECFVFDTETHLWKELPSLPEARYAPTVQLWCGRLHVIGGSKLDRNTPATDHWSLGIAGHSSECEWRREIPIPRGGPHRASAVVNNQLYVFGGQEGDYIAIPSDPKYTCTGNLTCEKMYADTYRLSFGVKNWERGADMVIQSSHTEFSIVKIGSKIVILGGQTDRNEMTRKITLTDAVQIYDPITDHWKLVGRMPYCSKSVIAAYYKGFLFMTTGQKEIAPGDPAPGIYDERIWKAKFLA